MKERILKVKDVDDVIFCCRVVTKDGTSRDVYAMRAYSGDFWQLKKGIQENDRIHVYFIEPGHTNSIFTFTGKQYLEMARKHNFRLIKSKKPSINFDPKFKVIMDEFLEQKSSVGILDKVEKEYLGAVIKPFRDQVDYIEKYSFDDEDEEFICIIFKDDHSFSFPTFKKGAMYAGMLPLKEYTLKELGL